MKQIVRENIIKNLILVLAFIPIYFMIQAYLVTTEAYTDKALAGDLLVAVSIIAVIACFGNFAFTYKKIHKENTFQRYLAHATTGLLMFVIGISLIFTATLISFIIGYFIIIDLSIALLYIASVLYDFWDLSRAFE